MSDLIRNREHKRQIVDFTGLQWGKITPTDIDMYVEFGGKLHVFAETKYHGAPMSLGQRLALEHACDGLGNSSNAIAFITSHDFNGDILLADSIVTDIRYKGEWLKPNSDNVKLLQAINVARRNLL